MAEGMGRSPDLSSSSGARLFLSAYTHVGVGKVYQVFRMSMPLMAENTSLDAALEQYRRHRQDFYYWHEGQRVNPLPEDPSVWDGDAGEWITTEEVRAR